MKPIFCPLLPLALCFALASLTAAPSTRPNIIFIMADDLGPDGVGAYGSELFANETPEIDALANAGLLFHRVYATGICSPSRAQFLTGQYPFRNGCLDIDGTAAAPSPSRSASVGTTLQDLGYTTGMFGKGFTPGGPVQWGFDEWIDGPTGVYWGCTYDFNGTQTTDPDTVFFPDTLQNAVLDFINRNQPSTANGQAPFFVYYPMIGPHSTNVSGPYRGKIPPTPLSDPIDADSANPNFTALYLDHIQYIDLQVGELVDHLDSLGLLDTTLILYCGDNGSQGSYQSRLWDPGTNQFREIDGSKADRKLNREGTAWVPLVAHWPQGISGPRETWDLVDFTDLLPTFVELAGGSPPTNRIMDGISFAPLLLDQPDWTPRQWIYQQIENSWAVRGNVFRLDRDGTLWDMSDAPFTRSEIFPANDTPESAEARVQLQAVLDAFDPASGFTYEFHMDAHFDRDTFDWKKANWRFDERTDTAISGDAADPDGDLVPNIVERSFGWDPNNGSHTLPSPELVNDRMQVDYPATVTGSGTQVLVEVSDDLTAWHSDSASVETTGSSIKLSRDRAGLDTTAASRFMRIRAVRSQPWAED